MIYLALTALFVGALAFQAWTYSRERKEEREAWAAERLGLLNRIQAPERVIEQVYEPKIAPAIDIDDDEAYWAEEERLRERLNGGS